MENQTNAAYIFLKVYILFSRSFGEYILFKKYTVVCWRANLFFNNATSNKPIEDEDAFV